MQANQSLDRSLAWAGLLLNAAGLPWLVQLLTSGGSLEADNWAQRALQEKAKAKAQNREKGSAGLVSFKIHKLFVKRLEQSEGLLLNLEQCCHQIYQKCAITMPD